jgi:hypothetical protein
MLPIAVDFDDCAKARQSRASGRRPILPIGHCWSASTAASNWSITNFGDAAIATPNPAAIKWPRRKAWSSTVD